MASAPPSARENDLPLEAAIYAAAKLSLLRPMGKQVDESRTHGTSKSSLLHVVGGG